MFFFFYCFLWPRILAYLLEYSVWCSRRIFVQQTLDGVSINACPILLEISFRFSISLLVAFFGEGTVLVFLLSITERGVLKFWSSIVELSFLLEVLSVLTSCISKFCCSVNTYSGWLCHRGVWPSYHYVMPILLLFISLPLKHALSGINIGRSVYFD